MFRFISICFLFVLITVNSLAEEGNIKNDLADIEVQERRQIIKELSFSLNTKQVCDQTINWQDSGSGADLDGYFFIPKVGKSEYMIGGHASQKSRSKYHCVLTVSEPATKPKGAPPLLVAPADWKFIWDDSGSGATQDGSFWQAIPPDVNYTCIGSVSQLGHKTKPKLSNYRCVHKSLTEKIATSAIVWSDKGSGADRQITIFQLPNTGTFVAVAKRANKTEAYDLRKNATSVPDPKMVEIILAERMAPIKADIEAKIKAKEEQRKLAETAEQKKLAEAAAKKKAEAAEQKRIAEEAEEKKKEVEAAAQVKIAEAIEDVPEQPIVKDITAEAKAQEEKPEAKEGKDVFAELEEELIPDFPDIEESEKTEEPIATTETSSTSEIKKAKGLDHLVTTFLKILGLMIGGLIFMIIAFKLVIGKNKADS